jgi:hypothetical protein
VTIQGTSAPGSDKPGPQRPEGEQSNSVWAEKVEHLLKELRAMMREHSARKKRALKARRRRERRRRSREATFNQQSLPADRPQNLAIVEGNGSQAEEGTQSPEDWESPHGEPNHGDDSQKKADIVESGTPETQESARGKFGPLTHISGDACSCKDKDLAPHRLREGDTCTGEMGSQLHWEERKSPWLKVKLKKSSSTGDLTPGSGTTGLTKSSRGPAGIPALDLLTVWQPPWTRASMGHGLTGRYPGFTSQKPPDQLSGQGTGTHFLSVGLVNMVSRTMSGEVSQVSGNPSGRADAYHQKNCQMKDQSSLLEEEEAGERPSVEQENSARYGATVSRAETDLENRGSRCIAGSGEVLSNKLHRAGPSGLFIKQLVNTTEQEGAK